MEGLTLRQKALLTKARSDFPFFCENFLQIKPKRDKALDSIASPGVVGAALVPFRFNQAQRIVWQMMCEQIAAGVPIKLVICKARQFGISTLFCAWIFWNMWRMTQVRAMIAAHKKPTLEELSETMNTFYQSLPEGARPILRDRRKSGRVARSTAGMYFEERNCDLKFYVATPDAVRGAARDISLNTEVSSYQQPDEYFGGFLPAMSENVWSTLVMESSPKDGYFWQLYKGARDRREDGRRAVFLPWWIVPELYSLQLHESRPGWFKDSRTKERVHFDREEKAKRDELSRLAHKQGRPEVTWAQMYWRQKRIEAYGGDIEFFNQEFPEDDLSCFMRSTTSAFRMALPVAYETSCPDAVEQNCPDFCLGELHSSTYLDVSKPQVVQFIEEQKAGWIDQEFRAGLCIYHDRKDGYTYTLGADVADESATGAEAEDESAYSVASVYCCNTREQVAEWRGHIDPFDFGDEIAKLGYYYNAALVNTELNNHGRTTYDRLKRYLNYPNRFRWPKLDEVGLFTQKEMWVTDEKTKEILISAFRWAIKNGFYKVRSPGLYDEMASYQSKKGRYRSGSGFYADRIIAAALSWQAVEQTDASPLMSLVIGSVGEERSGRSSMNQASRVREMRGGKPITAPPKDLPDEFRDMGDVQRVEDLWEAARL